MAKITISKPVKVVKACAVEVLALGEPFLAKGELYVVIGVDGSSLVRCLHIPSDGSSVVCVSFPNHCEVEPRNINLEVLSSGF